MLTPQTIHHLFTNHPPTSDAAGKKLDAITDLMIETANALNELVPESNEKAEMFGKLQECSMWAKAGIARNW